MIKLISLKSVSSGFSQSTAAREDHEHHDHHHQGGGCDHSHDHDHHHHHGHGVTPATAAVERKLPEELAEEEDMRLCGFGPCLDHIHEPSSRVLCKGNHKDGLLMLKHYGDCSNNRHSLSYHSSSATMEVACRCRYQRVVCRCSGKGVV